jgi:hypothetical protein
MRPLCICIYSLTQHRSEQYFLYKKSGSESHACVPFQGEIKKFAKLATNIFCSLCICVIMKRTWRSVYVYGISYYFHVFKMTAVAPSPNIMIKCRSNIPTLLLLLAGKSPQLRDWSRSIRFFFLCNLSRCYILKAKISALRQESLVMFLWINRWTNQKKIYSSIYLVIKFNV